MDIVSPIYLVTLRLDSAQLKNTWVEQRRLLTFRVGTVAHIVVVCGFRNRISQAAFKKNCSRGIHLGSIDIKKLLSRMLECTKKQHPQQISFQVDAFFL